jgi:hypothetical protein
MVPLEDALEKPERKKAPERRPAPTPTPQQKAPASPKPKQQPVVKRLTPLAPGQVRKKSTGEIGKVKAIDAKAGTATVTWLRDGRTSTVQISSVTRR